MINHILCWLGWHEWASDFTSEVVLDIFGKASDIRAYKKHTVCTQCGKVE